MEQAKIAEIFLSYQGEGVFTGSRQLFVRFYGCNMECTYCDTELENYKSFSIEGLLGRILDVDEDYNEIALTGGEPLLYGDFLEEFLVLLKKHFRKKIYLETNGTLPDELVKVIDHVDIVAMDIKLPSSSGISGDVWREHEEFIKIAADKDLIVKAVITDATNIDDIKKMAEVLAGVDNIFPVILQPVTPISDKVNVPDEEMTRYFREYLKKETNKEVLVLGQFHKAVGIR